MTGGRGGEGESLFGPGVYISTSCVASSNQLLLACFLARARFTPHCFLVVSKKDPSS